jgi:hypothetical protein
MRNGPLLLRRLKPGQVRHVTTEQAGPQVHRDGMRPSPARFPLDLEGEQDFPGLIGGYVRRVAPYSLLPPYPWASWCYGQMLGGRLRDVPGDYAEFGVALGGMSLLMGLIAQGTGRRVFSYDSFEGLPMPHPEHDNRYFRRGFYRGSASGGDLLQRFDAAIQKFRLDGTVIPVKGFFAGTARTAGQLYQQLAFVHADSDLYDSVRQSLETVYDLVSPGGAIAVDDFFHPAQGPARALADFCNHRNIRPLLHVTFPYSVVMVKGETVPAGARRALDGNYYSLDLLRSDEVLIDAVRRGTDAAPRHAEARAGLLHLLESGKPAYSDIYEYWRCLEYFWERIDYRPAPGAVNEL